jgi:hypothetical protein
MFIANIHSFFLLLLIPIIRHTALFKSYDSFLERSIAMVLILWHSSSTLGFVIVSVVSELGFLRRAVANAIVSNQL